MHAPQMRAAITDYINAKPSENNYSFLVKRAFETATYSKVNETIEDTNLYMESRNFSKSLVDLV